MDDVTPVVAALKRSGFPLQTRIEHEIRARFGRGWMLLASEHPWRSEDGDQFIDLIANCGTVVLVVECKKAQERSLLFLRPVVGHERGHETTGKVRTCTVWHFEPPSDRAIEDRDLGPESYQAAFCVTTDKSSQRLLEQDARPVKAVEEAGRTLGVQLHAVGARSPGELEGAFEAMARARVQAVLMLGNPIVFAERQRLAELAIKHRLSTMSEIRDVVEAA